MPPSQLICPKCSQRFSGQLVECPTDHTPLADARLADAMQGRTIGNFAIERLLGAGGMGMVFLAKHRTIGTSAVVKVLSPDGTHNPEARQRFLNEAKLASSISHPNVVRIFDFGETIDRLFYMVMELLPGEDLEAILRAEKVLPALRAARLLRQVARALEAAHGGPNGPVIHRDLKPANIRVARRGREEHAMVLDFGIAKALESAGSERLTQEGMVIGTPRYMAPEQACGEPVDARTDIYSLGVIAYEMVAGTTPYETSRLIELVGRQMQNPIPAFDAALEVPKAYTDIVLRCLAKEQKDRFASAGDLADALERFIDDAAGAAVRRSALTAVVGALLVGASIAILAWVFRPGATSGNGVPEAHLLSVPLLEIDGRDASGAPVIYVKGERARVKARIGGLASVAALAPELRVAIDGRLVDEVRTEDDVLTAVVGPLLPGRRATLEISVTTLVHGGAGNAAGTSGTGTNGSGAGTGTGTGTGTSESGTSGTGASGSGSSGASVGERRVVEILRRPIERDVEAPRLSVRPAPQSPRAFGISPGGVYLFREPRSRFVLAIDEAGSLGTGEANGATAKGPVTARADHPASASVESLGAGQAVIALDLSALRASEASLVDLRVTDAAGNEGRLSMPIVYDPAPPSVELAIVVGAERAAGGSVEPAWLVRAEGGALPREIRLRVHAADALGVAAIEPEIVESPSPGAASVSDVHGIATALAPSPVRAEVTFAVSIREEGRYRIGVRARDIAGSETRTAVAVVCEVPLEVAVKLSWSPTGSGAAAGSRRVDPEIALVVPTGELNLEATANKTLAEDGGEASAVRLVDGRPAGEPLPPRTLDRIMGPGNGSVNAGFSLPSGLHRFELLLRPRSSPPRTITFTALVDPDPPTLEIVRPASGTGTLSQKDLVDGAIDAEWKIADALSGIAGTTTRAFGFRNAAAWKKLAPQIAGAERSTGGALTMESLARILLEGGAVEMTRDPAGSAETTARARIRPGGMSMVVACVEVRDRAGNTAFAPYPWQIDSDAPDITAAPRAARVRLHEPIAIEISTGKPVAKVTVNGSADGVKKQGDASFLFETTMFLDTPEAFAIEAVDAAGNTGAREAKVALDPMCWEPTAEAPTPITDVEQRRALYRKNPDARGCPNCQRDAFSGKKMP